MSTVLDDDLPELSAQRRRIAAELDRLHESAQDSKAGQFASATFWRGVNLVLGVPASGLAAAAGVTGLATATSRVLAALLALASAVLGGVLTVVNASQRTSQATTAANSYLQLETDLRQTSQVDLPWMPDADARKKLQELTSRADEINNAAEPPSNLAWYRARRNRSKGYYDHAADKGKGKIH